MPSNPLVSVVMSVFNGERFLREAVESILSQTFRDFEFIIINDGSTDGASAILDLYVRSDARVRVYNQENKGLIDSLNRGCGLAQGKYIARMDADDIAPHDRLARQIEFLEKYHDVGVLGGALELIDGTGKTLRWESRPVEDQDIRLHLRRYCVFPHSAVVMRRELFSAAGGYRKFFVAAEDYDLFLRIGERCQLANLAEVMVKYRVNSGQVCTSKLRQLCLSSLAAQAFAAARREGKPEPVISAEKATPEVLVRLGVDQAAQHRYLVGGYAYWMGAVAQASEGDTFLRLLEEYIELSRSGPIDRYALSNAMFSAARIHYRQRRPARAMVCLGRAVLTRPIDIRRIIWEIFIHRTFPLRRRLGLRRRMRIDPDAQRI